jgi:uncharacterized protein YqjF (DUF2071 family)
MTNDESEIDRVAPTKRPPGWRVMLQRWADLLFLHWEIDPEVLRRTIPSALTLDLYQGRAFIGLVPFTMTGIRPPWGPPIWGLSSFHEVNVRTYVHRNGADPGVWFFSLDAANSLAVRAARRFWNLPYHRAEMRLEHRPDGSISYHSRRLWPGPLPAVCDVRYRPGGESSPARIGTLEHFLAERYILYAQGVRALFAGRVNHPAYPLQPANIDVLDESLLSAAGIVRPDTRPLAHYASEVRVGIFPLQELGPPDQ